MYSIFEIFYLISNTKSALSANTSPSKVRLCKCDNFARLSLLRCHLQPPKYSHSYFNSAQQHTQKMASQKLLVIVVVVLSLAVSVGQSKKKFQHKVVTEAELVEFTTTIANNIAKIILAAGCDSFDGFLIC